MCYLYMIWNTFFDPKVIIPAIIIGILVFIVSVWLGSRKIKKLNKED